MALSISEAKATFAGAMFRRQLTPSTLMPPFSIIAIAIACSPSENVISSLRLIITHSIPHSFFASILAAISFVKKSKSVFFYTVSIVIYDFIFLGNFLCVFVIGWIFLVFGRWCFSVSADVTP